MKLPHCWHWGALIVLGASLASCAVEPRSGGGGVSQPLTSPVARSVPGKPVHMGTINEPVALAGKVGTGRSGVEDYARLFAARLVAHDYLDAPTPLLVQEIPSLERGSWTVSPDNRMETRYVLRQTTWHDGTRLTTADLVFTWGVIMNLELPIIDRAPERSIEDMTAVDPHTIVIRWREPYIQADAYEIEPLPQHILEPLLLAAPRSLVNSAYWTHEWVGLGPYRLAEWVPGAHLKGKAFAGYALGPPRIEEFYVHFIPDANQAVARILAGTLDLTSGSMLKIEEGVLLREQWETRGEGVVLARPGNQVASIDFQFREPRPPPSRDVRVRRALAHALDRELLVETLHHGIAVPAYGFLRPEHPGFARTEQLITGYRYDATRAARLLAEAGWTRGPDGVLRSVDHERFDLEVRNVSGVREVKDAEGIVEFLKNVGINAEFEPVPRARQNDQEYRAKFPGASVSYQRSDDLLRWHSLSIPSDANAWRGGNRSGYHRTEADGLINAFYATLDRSQRYETLAQLMKLLSEDIPTATVYHVTDVFAVRKGLAGAAPPGLAKRWTMSNAHELYWEQ